MRRGFTLIECMISIAILAIFMSSGLLMFNRSLSWLVREADDQRAVEMLRDAAEEVRSTPYNRLPGPSAIEWTANSGVAFHVPAQPPYSLSLDNGPVRGLISVERIDADGRIRRLKVTLDRSGQVLFDRNSAGKAVRVRYAGRIRIMASGTPVNAALVPVARSGAATLVTLTAFDDRRPIPGLSVTVLRMKR